jgi:hypothetical protein
MSKIRYKIVPGAGNICPRCKLATQIREHKFITQKRLNQPFYYSRWFNCINPNCQTTAIMPEKFRVMRNQKQMTLKTEPDISSARISEQERHFLSLINSEDATIGVGTSIGARLHRRGLVQIAKSGRYGITEAGKKVCGEQEETAC